MNRQIKIKKGKKPVKGLIINHAHLNSQEFNNRAAIGQRN